MPALPHLANVVVSGILTGIVYGLMALGLSAIFGVMRIVNFAHGELMTLAMYAAVARVSGARARPVRDDAAAARRVLRARLRAAARRSSTASFTAPSTRRCC